MVQLPISLIRIDTPPIFNTVSAVDDLSVPVIIILDDYTKDWCIQSYIELLTVNQELLDTGTLTLQLGKLDIVFGVASVDTYELIGIDCFTSITLEVQVKTLTDLHRRFRNINSTTRSTWCVWQCCGTPSITRFTTPVVCLYCRQCGQQTANNDGQFRHCWCSTSWRSMP